MFGRHGGPVDYTAGLDSPTHPSIVASYHEWPFRAIHSLVSCRIATQAQPNVPGAIKADLHAENCFLLSLAENLRSEMARHEGESALAPETVRAVEGLLHGQIR